MFTIKSKANPIDILTLELDARLDTTTLGVEVYTVLGGYDRVFNSQSAWTAIANTKGIPVPGGGGLLIPVDSFTTVSMKANEQRSFYVTLHGPYLDSRADGLQKSGEADSDYDAFSLTVGSGLKDYKFPNAFDPTVSPKFTGVIHYKEPTAGCVDAATSTTTSIEYKLLIDATEFDDKLATKVSDRAAALLSSALQDKDGNLKEYAQKYQLKENGPPSSIPGRQTSKSTHWLQQTK